MESARLSITVQRNLAAKYDAAGRKAIDAAIRRWAAAGKKRGIRTIHVAVDDRKAMRALKVAPVKGQVTAVKVKRAVDALYKKLTPDYLVLVGSGDVVPFFEVPNPSFEGDEEEVVPTDNPYGCSRKFQARQRKSYLVPDRVMGRIPDLPASGDPSWLVQYLDAAAAAEPRSPKDYRNAYMVCCDTWKVAGRASARKIGESADGLMISPPVVRSTKSMKARLAARMHMIKCHGSPLDDGFYGERGDSQPAVLVSRLLKGKVKPGTVIGAMCCYGAEVFSPNAPEAVHPGEDPISITYLRRGAHGFAGSTNTAWVGFKDLQCADWIVTGFLKAFMEGASLGRSLLDSKQNLAGWVRDQGQSMGREEEKTLLQFILLGDPTIHPVVATKSTPARAGKAVAARRSSSTAVMERRVRRLNRMQRAETLRNELPTRVSARGTAQRRATQIFQNVRKMLAFAPKRLGLTARKVTVDLSTRKIQSVRSGNERVALAGLPRVAPIRAYDYYWLGRRVTNGRRRFSMVCVTTDASGTPLRVRLVVSS